jgi:hypothetical protein
VTGVCRARSTFHGAVISAANSASKRCEEGHSSVKHDLHQGNLDRCGEITERTCERVYPALQELHEALLGKHPMSHRGRCT